MNAIIFLNFQSDEFDTLKYNVKNAGLKILECSYRFQEENDGQMLYILSA